MLIKQMTESYLNHYSLTMDVDDIPLVGRATVVKPAITLGPGDYIVDVL